MQRHRPMCLCQPSDISPSAAAPDTAGAQQSDFEVSLGNVRYAVKVLSVPRGSSVPLEQPWSMASLQSRAAANNLSRPLAIVVAPRVSESAVQR